MEQLEANEFFKTSTEKILNITRLVDSDLKTMRSEMAQCDDKISILNEKISENKEEIKEFKALPHLVAQVSELLDLPIETNEGVDGGITFENTNEKCAIIKTSTRQTMFLPKIGLIDPKELKPADLVSVHLDTHVILNKLPVEYDPRVKAMEIIDRPTEQYTDIGGLDKQIQELIEAVVLPITRKELFIKIGIQPPKGVLLYGPPGTGKTLLARICAAQTKSTFLRLSGSQLIQLYTGTGASLIRDAFALAKEKKPAIIFIDEIDAVGTKRFDSRKTGDREVQRTLIELLNQLDGFSALVDIKVIAATNRVDTLDPALLRSGRLDKKIELPHPTEEGRAQIMQIHSRKMNLSSGVNFEELSRSMNDFNGAECKAVCVEAGMIALRQYALIITHENFMDAITEVQGKKKTNLNYYV